MATVAAYAVWKPRSVFDNVRAEHGTAAHPLKDLLRRHADLSVGIYEPKRVIQIEYEAKSARLGKNHRSHVESLRHRILAGCQAPSEAGDEF